MSCDCCERLTGSQCFDGVNYFLPLFFYGKLLACSFIKLMSAFVCLEI